MSTFGKVGARPLLLKNTGEYAEEQMYKELFKATVERTVVDLESDIIDTVGAYAFSNCANIGNVNLPNVTTLQQYAFASSTVYGDIMMPNLTTITGSLQFNGTFKGGIVSMPKITALTNDRPFYGFFQMNPRTIPRTPVTIKMDSLTTITGNIFYNCSAIGLLYAPRLTSISGSATFLNLGDWRGNELHEARLIIGDSSANTGLSMQELIDSRGFPFGANTSYGKVIWQCKDGTVTYDTKNSSWVQNPYS